MGRPIENSCRQGHNFVAVDAVSVQMGISRQVVGGRAPGQMDVGDCPNFDEGVKGPVDGDPVDTFFP